MTTQLSAAELQSARDQLQGYAPAQGAIVTLEQHNGDLEISLGELVVAEAGTAAYSGDAKTLRQVFLKNLRREICGDESFLSKVEEYNKSPGKAVLLTGLIVALIDLVTLPISPGIATIVVLWVLKIGVRTFCDYTAPDEPEAL